MTRAFTEARGLRQRPLTLGLFWDKRGWSQRSGGLRARRADQPGHRFTLTIRSHTLPIIAALLLVSACASNAARESVGSLKSKPDGTQGDVQGVLVSYATPGYVYVQEMDGSAGIRVNTSGFGLARGDIVSLSGTVWTDYWYERYIEPTLIERANRATVLPLSMPARSVGGADWFYNRITRSGQRGVQGGSGLNNIGLLVKIAGRVTSVAGSNFFVDDGSGRRGGNGEAGVMVFADGGAVPAVGDAVRVVGVVAAARYGTGLYPRILSGMSGDIVVP